jgi:hypothetical protein
MLRVSQGFKGAAMAVYDDNEYTGEGARRVVWFALGALAVSAAVALFLFADGYFGASHSDTLADEPRTIIESKT